MIDIKEFGGYDIGKLELLGKGTQGWVYKIDSQICIKVFKSGSSCKKEVKTLKMAQGDPHFPKLYSYGDRYIIRECIQGIELDKYLKIHPLTHDISAKIIDVYETLGRVGYRRKDIMLFHVFVTSDEYLRVIDTARVMKEKTAYPRRILEELRKLGYEKDFLEHVHDLRIDLYNKWVGQK